ncbi:MAG: glycosyltransferase family 4 protein [Dehalococcoidia bacterium]
MRVLQVNKFHYNRGGAETAYFATAELLERHGHDVIPFAMADDRNVPTPYDRYFVSNVELREESGGVFDRLAVAGRILYSREAEHHLDRLLRDTRPDVAHLHNVYHQLSPSVLRALGRHRVPVVMTLHDYKLICPAYTLYTEGAPCERCRGGRFYQAVAHRCVKGSRAKSAICAAEGYLHGITGIYRRHVKFYVGPSHFMVRKVVEFGLDPRRVTHVPNFVDPDAFRPGQSDGTYFAYAGRLENVKGVMTLLRAVRHSETARAHRLLIAGDGEQRGELEAFCRATGLDNVRFLGHLSQGDLEPVVAGAAFLVAPSEWYENAPMSVLEAAARAKAVVASDMGGLPELVKDGETGLVFHAGDVDALRAAVERLLDAPPLAADMGRRARAFVEETFSPEVHYRQLMAVYERALGTRTQAAARERG